MSPQLRKIVQDFLLEYQDSDFDNWATTDLLLETAVNLLRQCVVEDCKIPEDTNNWTYTKPIVGIDNEGKPIVIDSWDNKVSRSINNE